MWIKDPYPGDPKRPDPNSQHWFLGAMMQFYVRPWYNIQKAQEEDQLSEPDQGQEEDLVGPQVSQIHNQLGKAEEKLLFCWDYIHEMG